MSIDGKLVDPIVAASPDGTSFLRLQKGTVARDSQGGIVRLIRITEPRELPELPANTSLLGKAYEFTPSGTSFNKEIKLTLAYDVKELPRVVDSLILGRYEPETGWMQLETEQNVVAGIGNLTAPVEHFSIFAVLARTTDASFTITNVVITPAEKKYWRIFPVVSIAGKQVSISADVTNAGGQRGVYWLALMLDGRAADERFLPLEPLETQTVTFTLTGLPKGQHNLQIGNQATDFRSSFSIRWWLLLLLLLLVALASWLGYRFAFK